MPMCADPRAATVEGAEKQEWAREKQDGAAGLDYRPSGLAPPPPAPSPTMGLLPTETPACSVRHIKKAAGITWLLTCKCNR